MYKYIDFKGEVALKYSCEKESSNFDDEIISELITFGNFGVKVISSCLSYDVYLHSYNVELDSSSIIYNYKNITLTNIVTPVSLNINDEMTFNLLSRDNIFYKGKRTRYPYIAYIVVSNNESELKYTNFLLELYRRMDVVTVVIFYGNGNSITSKSYKYIELSTTIIDVRFSCCDITSSSSTVKNFSLSQSVNRASHAILSCCLPYLKEGLICVDPVDVCCVLKPAKYMRLAYLSMEYICITNADINKLLDEVKGEYIQSNEINILTSHHVKWGGSASIDKFECILDRIKKHYENLNIFVPALPLSGNDIILKDEIYILIGVTCLDDYNPLLHGFN